MHYDKFDLNSLVLLSDTMIDLLSYEINRLL